MYWRYASSSSSDSYSHAIVPIWNQISVALYTVSPEPLNSPVMRYITSADDPACSSFCTFANTLRENSRWVSIQACADGPGEKRPHDICNVSGADPKSENAITYRIRSPPTNPVTPGSGSF